MTDQSVSIPRMIWKGQTLLSHRDHFDAFCLCQSDDERASFIRQAITVNEHIPSNIQYMIGYVNGERANELWSQLSRARAAQP